MWLPKATPRDWLDPAANAAATPGIIDVQRATSRYGRLGYRLEARQAEGGAYTVTANVSLPPSFATADTAPAGGVRLRIRAPITHAGKLSGVTVGGKAWAHFNAAEETVDIAASQITASLISEGLPHIVATFSS